jgi:hypothetical protein
MEGTSDERVTLTSIDSFSFKITCEEATCHREERAERDEFGQ